MRKLLICTPQVHSQHFAICLLLLFVFVDVFLVAITRKPFKISS